MKLTLSTDKIMSWALALLATYAALLIPADALAQSVVASGAVVASASGSGGGNPIGSMLCGVVSWFTGPIGSGIATLAIIVIGVGALMGKVSWGMAIIVGIGVAVIFGAPAIVNMLGASGC